MPIYEYRCNECEKEFEVIQKFSDDPLTECIYCSGPVEKLISLSSFHLKGSGWYATDYAGKKSSGPADKPSNSCDQNTSKASGCEGCPSSSS